MPEKGVSVDLTGFGVVNEIHVVYILRIKQDGFQEWAVYRDYEAFQTLEFQVIVQ